MTVIDHTRQLRREVGTFALMLTGLGSIIGSGWLFGAWRASQLAGTGAVWAWVIGALVATAVALTYAEMGAMFPESGGMVRYAHYSHGSLLGFIAAWTNWIAVVSVIPVEAEASVQYMASWHWVWARDLYVQVTGHGELTLVGLAIAAVLVVVYFLINFWGVKLFTRSNTTITLFKLVVPAATGLTLMASGFDARNFGPDVPGNSGADLASILTAVATAGIVFSFNGFQSPVNLAGEARTPGRSIPIAVLGSIFLAAIIYITLQVAYLGTVPHRLLLTPAGWHGIDFRSPFAQLALLLNLNWLAILLYADAFVSPSGTGITYTATTARMLFGMERNGTLPKVLGRIHPGSGVPRPAMWFNLVVEFLFLFFFRGWGTLAAVISVATVISYVTGPISVLILRTTAAGMPRPLRVPYLRIIAAAAFVFATELLYWARWPLTGQVIVLIAVALPVYAWYQVRGGWVDIGRHVRGALWMIIYLPAVAAISWAGSSRFGGHGYLTWGWDLLVVALIALAFFVWAVRSGWETPAVRYACSIAQPPAGA
jgi:amino acid transporter